MRPVHMFFDREKDAQKILDGAFAHAGLEIKQGRMAGSPERLNLFTSDGDVLWPVPPRPNVRCGSPRPPRRINAIISFSWTDLQRWPSWTIERK